MGFMFFDPFVGGSAVITRNFINDVGPSEVRRRCGLRFGE